MKLQLVAVGTKMPDWVQTGFMDYLHRFPKDMPFELVEIPAGKRGKNADIKRILEKEGEEFRKQIINLKEKGWKTEPAFAKLLGLKEDPYLELLNYSA